MNERDDDQALDELEVIIPNLNWRYSGGTAVNRTIAPQIAKRGRAAWLGPHRPDGIRPLGLRELVRLRLRHPQQHTVRIWHARRNVEMIVGLLLKLIGYRFALIFNSAAQRRHTAFTDFLIARMDAVIATSEASASYVRRPATVVHHGIDTDAYCPPADRGAAFAASGLPGKYGIGTFGRLRLQKGTDVFVEAMCRLLPRYPDFTAVLIGRTTIENRPFVENLKARAAAAGIAERVCFLGELPIDEVPRWYQRIAIYVFASREEGFGLTMLEAMAAGNALVASRAGAAEMLVADGDTGVLIPTGDVDALVAALAALMRDPQRAAAMGSRARSHVVVNFSKDTEVDRIIAVYHKIWGAAERSPDPM